MRGHQILPICWLVLSCLVCALLGARALFLQQRLACLGDDQRAAREAVQRSVQDLRFRIAAAKAETAENEARLPGKRPKAPTELSDEERFDRMIAANDVRPREPAVQAYERRLARRQVQQRYGELLSELNLSPQEQERLKQLLMELQHAYSDAAALMVAQGGSSFSAEGRTVIARARSEVDADILQLLGTSDYERYKNHDRAPIERVFTFQGALLEARLPALTVAQQRALALAYADCPGRDIVKDPDGAQQTGQILRRVENVLSQEQAQAFARHRAEVLAARAASARFIRGE